MAREPQKKSRSQSVLRKIGQLFEISTIIGVVSAILTIGFGVGAVVNLDDPKALLYVNVSLVAIVAMLSVLMSVMMMRLASRDKPPISSDDLLEISKRFEALLHVQLEFESVVGLCINHVYDRALDALPPNHEKWSELQDLLLKSYSKVIKSIVECAALVITAKRGDKESSVSVNIKILKIAKSGLRNEIAYEYLVRSENSDAERAKHDKLTQERDYLVADHMTYSSFIDDDLEGDLVDGVYIIDDKEEYIAHREKTNEKRRTANLVGRDPKLQIFEEPSRHALRFYESCLVTPIASIDQIERSDDHAPVAIQMNDKRSLIGILCIDSKKKAYFDREYDVRIMKQLASHAYSAMYSYAGVQRLRQKLVEKHRPSP